MIDFNKEEQEFNIINKKFEEELKKLRVGRASISIVENIMADVYGVATPMQHISAISSPDPRSLIIKPWDKNNLPAVERALAKAALGLGVIAEKDQVRVTFPPLTEERRKDLVKTVGKMAEETRISLRKRRDNIWKEIQEEEKSGVISEDQKFQQKDKMEKMAVDANKKIVELAQKKESELMTI